MMGGALGIAGLTLSLAALFCAVWIVVPAPHRVLALLAVGASELSAWLLVAGGAGAGLGAAAAVRAGGGGTAWVLRVGWLSVLCGLGAAGLALVPPLQARPVATTHGAPLSPLRAMTGALTPSDSDAAVTAMSTVTYAAVDGQALHMDVYRPSHRSDASSGPGARPAVVVVHGGAWDGGKRSEQARWNRWLVARGYVVFDVDYRLVPQPNWAAATGDILCAVGTIKAQAAHWSVDPARVALLGRSAGGHLALLAAYTAAEAGAADSTIDPNDAGDQGVRPSCSVPDAAVRAVVSFYGPTDLIWGYEHPANQRVIDGRRTLEQFLGGTPHTARGIYERASPTTHVRPETPPTLLLHGGRDQFARSQHSERLASRLQVAGVPHETVLVPYAQHGFDYVFDGWGGQIVQATVARFLEAHVKG
ncbi:MAG: hypothetical protein AVDCRST_MAG77-6044 [uncultured Chloroflexi bacterium]|uniref:BD-FAE-like domain-containing protein n=1 Tax=uncultured Chloroflexota bacterium TaxID=166587 RepID=A0A6J4KGS3_9CHLR|nr:MAG: hypothetical protein AVDCRST_MAG77-6044 [uncultured Chloroflexota bacterium]